MFTNLLRVKLILWDGQLSINSKNITVSKHLIVKNPIFEFLDKMSKDSRIKYTICSKKIP